MCEILRVGNRRTNCGAQSGSGPSILLVGRLAVLVALVLAGVAPTLAHAAPPTAVPVQGVGPPPTVWGACPVTNREAAEQKLARRFDRAAGVTATGVTMPAGTSDLLCGNQRYGYYHIVFRHHAEWTQKGVITNENWREVADYSIAEALRNPTSVSFRAAEDTFCYSREVSLIDKVRGVTVDVMHPNVVVRGRDGAVITAFPTRRPC